MITALDSNILIGFWNPDDALNRFVRSLLDAAYAGGSIVICGAVYGELLACPGRTEDFINRFLGDTDITVDWSSREPIWRTAGIAFEKYARRRRRRGSGHPRRILTDFYIGAHALENDHTLLTLDNTIYRKAFPELKIVSA